MSDQNLIEATIRANASQYVAEMKSAGSVTASSARQMADDLSRVGDAAKETGNPLGEITGHIRGMRQEMRLSGFMAAQIEAMGIASRGAAGEVTNLFAAFAVGGGIGGGLEIVKLTVTAFNELGAEEERARVELEKYATETKTQVAALRLQIASMMLDIGGASKAEKLAAQTVAADLVERIELVKKLRAAREDLAATEKQEATDQFDVVAKLAYEVQLSKSIEQLEGQLAEVERRIAEKRAAIAPAVAGLNTADQEEAAQKALDEQEKIQDSWNQYRQQSFQQDQAQWQQHLLDVEKAQQEHQVRLSAAELESRKAIDKMLADQDKVRLDRQLAIEAQEDAEDKKRAAAMKRVADQVAASATASLRAVVDGTASVGDAIKGLFEDIAFEVIGMLIRLAAESIAASILGGAIAKKEAVSTTQGHIAEAVSGAAASQAFIPFAGPGLAAEAAAVMFGTLEGMTAPLLSARGGLGTVPRDGTIMAHAQETVLPAPLAAAYRRGAESLGQGEGGGAIHVHVHTLYADRDFLAKLPEHPDFIRGMREARRLGRAT